MIFNPQNFNEEVLIQKDFFEFVDNIRKSKIKLPIFPEIKTGYHIIESEFNNNKLSVYHEEKTKSIYQLNAKNGCDLSKNENILLSAYDESIAKYSALEGTVVYVSHSLIFLHKERYYPLNKLTISFITGSQKLLDDIPNSVKTNEKWGSDTTINVEVAKQKRDFLEKNCFENSIILIDGPFLAGDGMATFKGIIKKSFIEQNIIPVFIVKNSQSNLVINSFSKYKGKYNSDLHFANDLLNQGQRTQFFEYTDTISSDNSKVFCYMKFNNNSSPIRIEFPTIVFKKNIDSINSVLDLIYYLILVQGDYINPQPRPIAIAEMYARETLKLINYDKKIKISTLTPIMNEKRGMDYL